MSCSGRFASLQTSLACLLGGPAVSKWDEGSRRDQAFQPPLATDKRAPAAAITAAGGAGGPARLHHAGPRVGGAELVGSAGSAWGHAHMHAWIVQKTWGMHCWEHEGVGAGEATYPAWPPERECMGAQAQRRGRGTQATPALLLGRAHRWDKARLLGSLLATGLRPMRAERVKQEIEAMKVGGQGGGAACSLPEICVRRVLYAVLRPSRRLRPCRFGCHSTAARTNWLQLARRSAEPRQTSSSPHALKALRAARAARPPQHADVMTRAMAQFASDFPRIVRPLLDERDEYMVGGLCHSGWQLEWPGLVDKYCLVLGGQVGDWKGARDGVRGRAMQGRSAGSPGGAKRVHGGQVAGEQLDGCVGGRAGRGGRSMAGRAGRGGEGWVGGHGGRKWESIGGATWWGRAAEEAALA